MTAGPRLVFDLARIEANLRRVAAAARAAGIRPLFAAKSFPHPAVRALAAELLDGFDVASPAEVRQATGGGILSVVDPTGTAAAAAAGWPGRLIVGCETVDEIRAAPAGAQIAIRISASLEGRDPAVGAVLEGSGRRRSRFGLDVDPARRTAALRELVHAAAGRTIGLHVHHGPVVATSGDRFAQTARAVLAAAAEAELAPAFLDLGGAWHGVAELPAAFAAVRAAVPAAVELLVEPGRLYADGAGEAHGTVAVARALDDRALRVLDLSRICHLRWSAVELVAPAPRPGEGVDTLLVGPTCYEDDVIGSWTVAQGAFPVGARVVLRGVTGYALAWNTGFGGVPPAEVVVR